MSKCVICALATPYLEDKIDVSSYVQLCKRQQDGKADALLALGTTAEAQLLTKRERKLLVTLAKTTTSLPVMVGIEEACTREACRDAELYAGLGADALMIAPPSFCKCTPTGFVQHVEAIRKASGLPIVLYNIPARASYNLDVDAIRKLTELGYVKYVKDSSLNMCFAHKILPYANVLCGSDERLKDYLEAGACGVVSVAANVAPQLTKQAAEGDCEALTRFERLAELAMSEINPIAIKYILYKAGVFKSYEMRLPLTKASEKTRAKIDNAWSEVK